MAEGVARISDLRVAAVVFRAGCGDGAISVLPSRANTVGVELSPVLMQFDPLQGSIDVHHLPATLQDRILPPGVWGGGGGIAPSPRSTAPTVNWNHAPLVFRGKEGRNNARRALLWDWLMNSRRRDPAKPLEGFMPLWGMAGMVRVVAGHLALRRCAEGATHVLPSWEGVPGHLIRGRYTSSSGLGPVPGAWLSSSRV